MSKHNTKLINHYSRSPNFKTGHTNYHGNGVWKKQAAASSSGCLFSIVLIPITILRTVLTRKR